MHSREGKKLDEGQSLPFSSSAIIADDKAQAMLCCLHCFLSNNTLCTLMKSLRHLNLMITLRGLHAGIDDMGNANFTLVLNNMELLHPMKNSWLAKQTVFLALLSPNYLLSLSIL